MNREIKIKIWKHQYKNIPISPAIAKELILKLFKGGPHRRKEIINLVTKFHLENGGKSNNSIDRKIKRALANLKNENLAENVSTGFWSFQEDEKKSILEEDLEFEDTLEIIPNVYEEITFGKGEVFVYIYYFPIYRQSALDRNIKIWPCKIGISSMDPLSRILSQSGTALPEKPEIGLIIKTDNASILEKCIHTILTLKGRYINESPGVEWFNTSPNEVKDIVNWINHEILENK